VSKAIERLPRKDGQILLHLEPLITAGFVSRRRSIVNISIATWNKTFGKEESLRYPNRLEQALRRLHTSVKLSLPSLEIRDQESVSFVAMRDCPVLTCFQVTDLSFYDSDNSKEDVQRTFKSPSVKQSPFKISRSARRSLTRSPAVPTSGSRRTSARQTPKVRLRHDNSQIQFEPIVSSPSNPFNQESQVLTERQKEMIERQRLSSGLFANMDAPSPQRDAAPSPMELHSDVLTADDLPVTGSRITPLKALAAMGPMDAFLDSSPTPHARKSTRHIVSDETSVATPTAVRTVKLAENDEVGSSPPQFEKDDRPNVGQHNSVIHVGSSFEYRQPENLYNSSFNEGTTIDEDALLAHVAPDAEVEDRLDINPSLDVIMSELPSSTIDLQLTAQLDADIQAHTAAATQDTNKPVSESNNVFVDAASHLQASILSEEQAGNDVEVEESRPSSPVAERTSDFNTSSTPRVGDSFSKTNSEKGTPQSQTLRRSFRHSGTASPLQSLGKKTRKSTPAKTPKEAKRDSMEDVQEEQTPTKPRVKQLSYQPDEDSMLDNIVVVSPARRQDSNKKRKFMSDAGRTQVAVPETNRKRGPIRRSQSLLSQVENSQDVLVEDAPAPKRPRQSASQDVSEAKNASQPKRLSHVQVTPKRSSEHSSSVHGTPEAAPLEKPIAATETREAVPTGILTPNRSFKERVILTPRSIINQLRSLKDYLFSAPQLVLGKDEEREIDDALFDIRRQVHAAGARGEEEQKMEE
jgi:hypothetical protein